MKQLILIANLFIFTTIFCQKTVVKTVASNAKNIIIQLDNIDILSLKTTNTKVISVTATELISEASYFTLSEEKGSVIIKSVSKSESEKPVNVCFEQPLLTSYRIEIPKNKTVEIQINNGNFSSNKFVGNLVLNLKQGEIAINDFIGNINILNISGKIDCSFLNGKIVAETKLGAITSKLDKLNLVINQNLVTGFVNNELNSLKIQTVRANINLKPLKIQ